MTAYGFDWVWDANAKNGMGGFVCHIHSDEDTENADFLAGLHDRETVSERLERGVQYLSDMAYLAGARAASSPRQIPRPDIAKDKGNDR